MFNYITLLLVVSRFSNIQKVIEAISLNPMPIGNLFAENNRFTTKSLIQSPHNSSKLK